MNLTLSRPLDGIGVSVDLHDFEPPKGYNRFLRKLCKDIHEKFMGWHQGPHVGIGRMSYQGYRMRIFWTDFPMALSFDCRDQAMAEEWQARLQAYFAANPELTADRGAVRASGRRR